MYTKIYSKIVALSLVFLFNSQFGFSQMVYNVTALDAYQLSKNGAIFLDVREEKEIQKSSYLVERILYIPLNTLENNLNLIPKDVKVIVACESGKRSKKATEILIKNGFSNCMNLLGGISVWSEAGFPFLTNDTSIKAKPCCPNPNSKDCNPDGTCKPNKKC